MLLVPLTTENWRCLSLAPPYAMAMQPLRFPSAGPLYHSLWSECRPKHRSFIRATNRGCLRGCEDLCREDLLTFNLRTSDVRKVQALSVRSSRQ